MAIDYDRRSLFDITNRGRHDEFADTIKNAKDFIANYDAVLANNNKINAAVYCFRSKNFYGMKDVQQVEVAATPAGDVPVNSQDIVAALPEVPDNAVLMDKPPIVMESSSKESVDNGKK